MVPYNDFQLTEKQIDLVKRLHQRRAIRQYIKENGVEPEPELVNSWYTCTKKEREVIRLAYYSVYLEKANKNEYVPEPPVVDNDSYFICVMKGPWTEEEAEYYNEHYQGLAGVTYEFIKLSYDEYNNCYYARNIDTTKFMTSAYGQSGGFDSVGFVITKGNSQGLTALRFGNGTSSESILDVEGKPRGITYGEKLVVEKAIISDFSMTFYEDKGYDFVQFLFEYNEDGVPNEKHYMLR